MEITNQNLVQLSNNVRNVPCAHLFDALVYLSAFLKNPLLHSVDIPVMISTSYRGGSDGNAERYNRT